MKQTESPARSRLMRRSGLGRMLTLGALCTVGACSAPRPKPGTAAATAEWPPAWIGSWALVERGTRGGVPDTAVWALGPSGLLEHREVRVRRQGEALTARERAVAKSRWWTTKRVVQGQRTQVMCMSRQPGRNSQCAAVSLDAVPDARGGSQRRLTWTGVTFRDQHWTFTERIRK